MRLQFGRDKKICSDDAALLIGELFVDTHGMGGCAYRCLVNGHWNMHALVGNGVVSARA